MKQMQSLRERQTYLQAQLAVTSPQMSVAGENAQFLNPQDRLRALEVQYTSMKGEFGDKHPTVAKILSEMEALRKVVKSGRGGGATNPAYIQLQAQLKATVADVEALQTQEKALQERTKDLETKIAKNPGVERDYLSLKREYDSLALQYETVRTKGGEAQLAQSLETERMGEKFSVIEPPGLPLGPSRPNRPAILLLGIVAALGAGIGSALIADKLGGKLYGARQLAQIVGAEPLAVVPYLQTKAEAHADQRQFAYVASAAAAVIVAIMAYVHFFVTPLSILAAAPH
jgi:uncharacterized protein involved in exopolysaccharide biosynthesis